MAAATNDTLNKRDLNANASELRDQVVKNTYTKESQALVRESYKSMQGKQNAWTTYLLGDTCIEGIA